MSYRYALLASQSSAQRSAYDEALSWLDMASGAAETSVESEVVDRITAQILEQAGWREMPAVRAPLTASPVGGVGRGDLDLPTRV